MLYNCAVSSNNAFYGGGTAGSTLNHCAVFGNTADAGGGAFNGIFSNCTFSANSATGYYGFAGGVYQGTLWNCTVSGNRAMTGDGGGGAYASGLNNCTVTHNYAGKGAGAVHSTLNNCTITDNQASVGGGVYLYCFLRNCIVYDNTASGYSNYDNTCMLWHSCSTPLAPGSGNITNGPAFVNAADGNYRLQPNSPCINAGKNAYVRGNTDLDDNPRVVGGTVDMGAYEYQTPASTISYAWLQQYGLPADGSADFADPDSDALNNWQEWRADTDPTNAASTLRMLAPTRTLSGVTISWASVTTRSYSVERATNLCASPAFSLVQSNIPGQAGATSFTDTNTVAGTTRFYRVRVEE
jgi:hypothetical protein